MATFTHHNRWFLKATTLLLVTLILIQLVLTRVSAESSRKIKRNSKGNRNSHHRKIFRGEGPHYDAPILQPGHSYGGQQRRTGGNPNSNHHVPIRHHHSHKLDTRRQIRETENHIHHSGVDTQTTVEDEELKKNMRIEQVKENILKQLNFESAPNMSGVVQTSNPTVKKMIDEVDESNKRLPQSSDFLQDVPVQMKNIFIPVEDNYPFDYKLPDDANVMYFKLNQGDINLAYLHFYIKPVPTYIGSEIAIRISKILPPTRPGGYVRYTTISRDTETVHPERGVWTKIPIYKMVSEWTKDPSTNLGMAVQMVDTHKNKFIVTNSTEESSEAPLLEVRFTREGRSKRPTRSLEDSRYPDGELKCRRFPLPINFTEHSFDFVVAPKVYMANFCNGKCGYLYAQQAIHHSIVQKLHNSTATYGPCCGAKNLMSINMLYYDHDKKIRLDVINDMIIEQCSCD